MKKLKILIVGILAVLSFNSCSEEDDFTFVAQEDPEGVFFVNSTAGSYTLRAANRDNLGERFVWNEVDFDVPTTVRYELQASTNESFSDFAVMGSDIAETNFAVSVGNMLDLAADAGLDNDPETEAPNTGTLYFRVRAYAGNNSSNNVEQISEPLAVNIVLPEATGDGEEQPAKPQFYLVGDATAAGWDPANNNMPLFRDAENDNIFYFEGRFAGGADVEGFKLVEVIGEWQPQWGLSEGNLTNSTLLGGDPAAFPVDEDAFYSLMVNAEDMTYTFEPIDAADAATYETIGLVGEGTSVGWPSDDNPTPDIEFTNSTFNSHIWYAENVTLTEGPIKFRAEKAWDINWGGDTFPSGRATLGGNDIAATAGTYNIWFNDLSGRYILIPVAGE